MTEEDIAAEHQRGRNLKQQDIDGFVSQGVPPLALARNRIGLFDWVLVDYVAFLPESSFEFHRHMQSEKAELAYTVLVRDVCGDLIDIVAWQPTAGRLATWLGRAGLLGAEQLYGPRLEGVLAVQESPLDWLRAFRNGVVVIDEQRAAGWLRDAEPLAVSSVEHGRHLKQILTPRQTRIFVSAAEGIAA